MIDSKLRLFVSATVLSTGLAAACTSQPLVIGDHGDGVTTMRMNGTGGAAVGTGGSGVVGTGGTGMVGAGGGGPGPSSAIVLASTRAPWGIAVDTTTVYVAGQRNQPLVPLVSVPIGGGATTTLDDGSVFTVAIDLLGVYWSDGTSIFSCNKVGCDQSRTTLATPAGAVHGIAVDAHYVYWTTTSGGTVMKVDKRGVASAVMLATGSYPYQVASDGANVYWTDQPDAVMTAPIEGGNPARLATEQGPMGIALDAQNVYVTTGAGKIVQVSKQGGSGLTLATDLGNEPWGIATDGTNVYAASMANGTIVKVPVGGGPEVVLVSGLRAPAGVTVDATSVYWTDVEAGTVMKTAK